MKPIDAEKLLAVLERQNVDKKVIEPLIRIIDSLQQEQESVAERFARIVRGNLTGIDEKVQHEFEQLYFEITGNKMYGGYND